MKCIRLFTKESRDIFRSRAGLLFFLLLSFLIGYSFYMAIDLYSKASLQALYDPLYATGFEPVPGVFVPTFGGFFVLFSLFAPFVFIKLITDEKKLGTLYLIVQYPCSMFGVYFSKISAGVFFTFTSLILLLPSFVYWHFLGGHIPLSESALLIVGYFLYGLFVLSVSLFSASIFNESAQASILALSIITFSWFIDFGREMHMLSFLSFLSDWSITENVKYFESGIFSLRVIFYIFSLIVLFAGLGYVFFDINIRKKVKNAGLLFLSFILSLWLIKNVNYNVDLTESHRNSFSPARTAFLKKLPPLFIKIYLDPADSRAKDYEHDFLKRLKLVKSDVKVEYASPDELRKEYGFFVYSIDGRSMKTYSNSEEEIFMILQKLSGIKLEKEKEKLSYKGYPLVAKGNWKFGIFLIYIIIIPVILLGTYLMLLKDYKKGGEYV